MSNPNTVNSHVCVMQKTAQQHPKVLTSGAKLLPKPSNTHGYILIPLGGTDYSTVYAEINIAAAKQLVSDLNELIANFKDE